MQKPIIAVITLVSAYAVANILETPTPPVMQPAATATVESGGGSAVVEIPPAAPEINPESTVFHGPAAGGFETPEPPGEVLRSTQPPPAAEVGVRVSSPRGSGFCADGSCGVAQASRRVVVQRPQRSGLFGGRIFRGRR